MRMIPRYKVGAVKEELRKLRAAHIETVHQLDLASQLIARMHRRERLEEKLYDAVCNIIYEERERHEG